VLSGNVIEGRPAIEMSLSLLKEQTNLEYAYSVEVLQLYGQIVSDLERRPSAKLIVESRPENAVVVVDSREAMQSPATLTNLMAGPHLVRVTRDGYEQWAGFVTVKGGEDNVISVPLKAIPDKDVFDQRLVAAAGVMRKSPEEAKAALGDLKAFLGTDELLVLECGVVAESYELKGFQVKADGTVLPIKRAITRDANFLASVKEFLSGLFESFYELSKKAEGLGGPPIDPTILQKAGITAEQTTGVFDPDNPVFPTIDIKKKDESLTSKWWFWVGAGVLVGGAVAGGLALALAQGSGAGPTGTLQVDINCPQK
jgi:hypothetical protein